MSHFPFAEVAENYHNCRMSEKTANPLEQFVLLAKTAKVNLWISLSSQIPPGCRCRGVDQAGLGGSRCLCLWGVAWYVKCPGLPFSISSSPILHPRYTFHFFQDLENGPHASHLALLNTFAYGNYRSLMDNKANLPELTEVMVRKLRLLTMVRWYLPVTVGTRLSWEQNPRWVLQKLTSYCPTASFRRNLEFQQFVNLKISL